MKTSLFKSIFLAVLLIHPLVYADTPSTGPGTVAVWGKNTYRETNVPNALIATTVSAGYWHNLVVNSAGKVVAWGLNDFGQTNVPSTLSNVVAVAGGRDFSLALRTNGIVVGWGDDTYGQTDIPSDLTNDPGNAIAIAAGAFHAAALRTDSTVECWGYDQYGQTETPNDLTNVIAIACGNSFTLALRNDGTVVGWGDDFYDQTIIPDDATNVIAIAAGGFHALAAKSDGSVIAWGFDDYGQADVPPQATNVISVAGGYYHSLALRNDGTVVQWGDTSLGQGGATNFTAAKLDRILAISGGYEDSIALRDAHLLITSQPVDTMTNIGANVRFTVKISGATPATYRWRLNATNIISTTLNSSVISNTLTLNAVGNNNAGEYTVIVSNVVGVVTSSVANLFVYSSDSPSVLTNPASLTVNAGSNVTFSVFAVGAPPLNYQWWLIQTNFGGPTNTLMTNIVVDATNSFLALNNVQGSDAGKYFVTISNDFGSAVSSNATLTVRLPPSIITQPADTVAVSGTTAKFFVTVSGTTPYSVRWWFNDTLTSTTLSSSTATNTLTLNSVTDGNMGAYYVVISNIVGAVTSSVANLTVVDNGGIPVIVMNPTNVTINPGSNALFSAYAIGDDPLTYQWYLKQSNTVFINNTNVIVVSTNALDGETNTFVFIQNAQAADAGAYFVIVSNLLGVVQSSNAVLTLRLPPTITSQSGSITTNAYASVLFRVTATGLAPLTYRWRFANDTGSTNFIASAPTLMVNNVQSNNAGNYYVIVSNVLGSATSQVATLTVVYNPALTPPQIYLLGHGVTGDALRLAMEAGKNYRVQGSTNLTEWFDVTNFLSSDILMDYTNGLFQNPPMMFYRIVSP